MDTDRHNIKFACRWFSYEQDRQIRRRIHGLALELAGKAAAMGETPVGAVVVQDGKIIGTGHNLVEAEKDPTAHAEIVALREAARFNGDWRLPRATVYVTLEPCIMCAAALVHARVKRLVFGARDHQMGRSGQSVRPFPRSENEP